MKAEFKNQPEVILTLSHEEAKALASVLAGIKRCDLKTYKLDPRDIPKYCDGTGKDVVGETYNIISSLLYL